MSTEWGNLENLLSTSPGLVIFLLVPIIMIPVLVFVLNLRQRRRLDRSSAFVIWFALGVPPLIFWAYLRGAGFPMVGTIFLLASAIPLLVGVIALAFAGRGPETLSRG